MPAPTLSVGADLANLTPVRVAASQSMRVYTGRDSARSLNPPQVPRLYAMLVSSGTDIAPYAAGDLCRVTQTIAGQPVHRFTGILDEPRRVLQDGRYYYRLSAIGLSSRLTSQRIYTAVMENITIRNAIIAVLTAAGLTATEYEVDTTGLTGVLSYFWVWGETPWVALARLLQSQGPPSAYYEDGAGVVQVLGTGWPSDDARPVTAFGGGAGLPVVGRRERETPTLDVVNTAVVVIDDYAESALQTVWQRSASVTLTANEVRRIVAETVNPFTDHQTPTFTTDSGAATVAVEDVLARRLTIVLTAGAAGAELSDLSFQARVIQVVGQQQSISDDADADNAASIATYGGRPWQGRPYAGISSLTADSLADAIPIAYRDGIEAERVRVLVREADEPAARVLGDLASVRIDLAGDDFEGRVRELIHDWQQGLHFIDAVIDQDGGLLAAGINPFILGTSELDGPDVLWL